MLRNSCVYDYDCNDDLDEHMFYVMLKRDYDLSSTPLLEIICQKSFTSLYVQFQSLGNG